MARGGSGGGGPGGPASPLEKREIIFGVLKKVTANSHVLSRKLSEKEDKEDGGAYVAI